MKMVDLNGPYSAKHNQSKNENIPEQPKKLIFLLFLFEFNNISF